MLAGLANFRRRGTCQAHSPVVWRVITQHTVVLAERCTHIARLVQQLQEHRRGAGAAVERQLYLDALNRHLLMRVS
eukprot:352949-Chlamydomonas_euryale.AAC.6